jgi:hypothetical protein
MQLRSAALPLLTGSSLRAPTRDHPSMVVTHFEFAPPPPSSRSAPPDPVSASSPCQVLYRAEQHRDMELKRNLAVESTAIFIQKHVRRKFGITMRNIAPA